MSSRLEPKRATTDHVGAIEPASRVARILLAALVLALLVGAFFSEPLFDRLGTWLSEDPHRALGRIEILLACLAGLSLPLLAAGILTCRSGLRSIATKRFPPRGMWVIMDTPIETGHRARVRGRILALGGILMVVVAIAVPAALWYIVHSMFAVA